MIASHTESLIFLVVFMVRNLFAYLRHSTYRATGFCFLSFSVLFALWITRIPEVKDKLALTEGELGTALFFMPLGAILSMLIITNVIRKIGEGNSAMLSLSLFGFLMICPVVMPTYLTLCIALFMVGFSMGWVDISINAVANTLEKENDDKIMATSHGFFSLGGIIGGLTGGLLAENGFPAIYQMGLGAIAMVILLRVAVYPHIRTIRDSSNSGDGVLFAFPTRPLLGLAVIAFCIMMAEGAITDWSTVYLSHTLKSSAAVAGIGFAIFSGMMTLGRFNGDYMIHRFGHGRILKAGLAISIVGLCLLFVPQIRFALVGFGLAGLGYSSVIPIVFSQASRKNTKSPALSLASVATLGYFGFLIGPVLIGWFAEWIGLGYSFSILMLLTILALILSFRERRASS